MYFEVLQSLSLNGTLSKPNDDRVGSTARCAWVVDGATDLGAPGLLGTQGGASWLSSTASRGFAMSDAATLRETCAFVFHDIAERFAAERTRDDFEAWEMPKAAFAAAQIVQDQLEVAWSADCTVLRHTTAGVTWCTAAPDSASEVADARALGEGVGSQMVHTPEVLEDRRAHRARPNHQALSADAMASEKATQYAIGPIAIGDEVLVMSDGFSALVSDYATYTGAQLMQQVQQRGLSALATELRQIEDGDAECLRYPRFKVSDDATAIWLRVCG